jgi:uncharacterized membrane protein YciS (DUF1049 family)
MTQQINIRLEGEKAVEYLRKDSTDRLKTLKYVLFTFGFSIGFVLIVVGISVMFASTSPPQKSLIVSWIEVTGIMTIASWSSVGKFLVILFAPIIALSWLLHGVQARLFA